MINRDKPTGITRLIRAFGYSLQGFRHTWREEAAFRQEVCLALAVIPAGLYLGHSGIERALLVWPMLQILVVEILNSAVEAVVDRGGTERHPLAGMAKDMGSAAVMLSFVLLGTVWVLILSDHGH
jgi:diacylglycerol kinase (ATP)